jgi:four helix bundle protein
MAVHNFRKMEIWIKAMELTKSVYKILPEIPNEEKFGLKSQLSRSSVSVPSNIAEGSGRSTNKDFSNFLSTSIGSCYELETQLILVQEIFSIDCEKLIKDCQQVQKMIFGFKNNLK